ncbi:hypothetical protein [Pyxidicoccus xibeiensis]|uniref:hypothetical protein n=1 Tax=Pyxidicoccus xibeiensis TaxID=2906759 RepID=UPI0020A82E30|nr:hypothetical protein [Pyxidicoccus xibeiensis]MCP3138253.1 hypothetical protein [Pyxidicoccus xibeiensis]
MRRFLFVMMDAGGNVPPQLGIVRRLAARGHAVRVLADRVLRLERASDLAVEELESLAGSTAAAA